MAPTAVRLVRSAMMASGNIGAAAVRSTRTNAIASTTARASAAIVTGAVKPCCWPLLRPKISAPPAQLPTRVVAPFAHLHLKVLRRPIESAHQPRVGVVDGLAADRVPLPGTQRRGLPDRLLHERGFLRQRALPPGDQPGERVG